MAHLTLFSFALLGTSFAMPTTPNKRQNPLDVYKTLTCTDDITNLGKNPASRWDAAMAGVAIQDFDHFWKTDPMAKGESNNLDYVNSFVNWLQEGLPDQDCGFVIDSCDFSSLQCKNLKAPAYWEVLISLSSFHSFYLNLFESLAYAKDDLVATMGSFVGTFAPEKPDATLIDNILKGFQSMAFDLFVGAALGPLGDVLKDKIGDLSDNVLESAQGAFDEIKEHVMGEGAMPEELSPEEKRATLAETLQGMVDNWYNGLYSYIDSVINGEFIESTFAPPFSKMAWTFREGRWLFAAKFERDMFVKKEQLRKAFAGMLVPTAWKLADRGTWGRPIILMKNENCWQGKPTHCMADDAVQFGSCAVEGKTMYLIGYTGAVSRDINGYPIPGCPSNTYVKLPGIESLNDAAGIDKDEMISSVWNAYVQNGYKNGFNLDLQNSEPTDGIKTPGLYQIPICDLDEAWKNYQNSPGGGLCDYGGW